MRRVSLLSSLAASLVALTLGAGAAASPGLVAKRGAFQPQGVAIPDQAPASALEKAARRVLEDQVEASRSVALGPARHVALRRGDRIVKLPQQHGGLPVVRRGATVAFAGQSARLVAAHLETDLPDDVTPALTSDMASAIAEARTGLPVGSEQVTLALWPTPEGVKLAWAAVAQAIPGIPYQPVTVVDAETGDILYVYNAIFELNQSQVFPSNPVKSPELVGVTLPVGEGKSVLENDLVQSFNCIDQKTVKKINFSGFMLDVHTCDLIQTALPDENGDYLIPVADDKDPEDSFSEVSMFHHVNRAYDLFRGWDPSFEVQTTGPIGAISNLRIPQGFDTFDLNKIKNPDLPLVPFQNAFFAPGDPLFSSVFDIQGGAMWFGQGPVHDYSYDGDVVYHEFVHAVVNATIKLAPTPHMDEYGAVYSPGGMNEGLADYFSSAITGDGDVGEYASQDFFPGSKAIRSLTNPDACPTAIGGEVHQDATLFSGALWDVRVTLEESDKVLLDEAVFSAMNIAPSGELSYEEVANLIIGEAKSIAGDPMAQALTAAFTARGVLPKCTRILDVKDGEEVEGPKELQNLWFAPGTQTTGAKNSAGDWTPGVIQFHLALPAKNNKLKIAVRKVNVGGGGGFGGGTSFTPKFLVRFSKEPVTFSYAPTVTTPDVLVLDGTEAGNNYSLTVDVPAGATDVHVMVGSTGQSDGAYTAFSMTTSFEEQPGAGGGGGQGGAGVGGAGGGDGGAGGGGGDDVVAEGCGCSLPGSSAPAGAGLAAIAALGLVAARRRRRS